jgi:lipopolysaccharide transport system ATP-binding protein
MTPSIQFENVSKKYTLGMTRVSLPAMASDMIKSILHRSKRNGADSQAFWALRDVSFELMQGESLALVGANGAGKSTTLKLLAKITRPTSGRIKVNGQLSALIELGAGFHPDLSGRENIYLNGAILGLSKDEITRRFDSIVSFAELEKFIDTPVKRYSSGMAVRLGFAVAASIDPDILLVDEVLAVGDGPFQMKCVNRIHELIDNGTTFIFVSHNMGLVKAVCKKALYINKGEMKMFGNTEDIIDAYNRDLNQQRISKFVNNTQAASETLSATAHITKVDVKGMDTPDESVIMMNRPVQVTVHYQAFQDLGDVTLAVRFNRSDGVSCCNIFSHTALSSLTVNRGFGKFSITVDPLQLLPSNYQVSATLRNKNMSHSYDWSYSDWFFVEGGVPGYIDLDAVYEPHQSWKHEQTVSLEEIRAGE